MTIKIGTEVTYTFMDSRIMVNKYMIYQETKPTTLEGMVIAVWNDYAYIKTKEGTFKVLKSALQVNN
jgi:hypothetical protein